MTPSQQSSRKAAGFATKLDFYLLGASSINITPEQREANLGKAFRLFLRLLPHMRDLKAQNPALYKEAEDELRQAREIAGEAG